MRTRSGCFARSLPRPARWTLFADFDRQLKERGYLAMGGQIVDATLVAAPRQRNTAYGKPGIDIAIPSFGYRAASRSAGPSVSSRCPARTAKANAAKSKVRARVEHVFARQKDQMGLFIRTIGLHRAEARVTLANLAYNMHRLIFHERSAAMA